MKIKLLFLLIILCGCRCELKIDSKQHRNGENTNPEQVEADDAAAIGFTNVVIVAQ